MATASSESGPLKPFVLIVCHPLTGHLTPLMSVAAALVDRGWTVGFLGPTAHRARIESVGVEFFQLQGKADLNDSILLDANPPVPNYHELPWHERTLLETRAQCFDTIPDQWASIKAALAALHDRSDQGSARQVVIVCEAFAYGILPMKYGAPLPPGVPEPRSLCVSVTPPMIRSKGQAPFVFSEPFDPSPAGLARSEALWEKWIAMAGPMTEHLDSKLREAGSPRGTGVPFLTGSNYTCHEAILQIGLPSFEYPRDDWPHGFTFVGIMPQIRKSASSSSRPGATTTTTTAEESERIPWWKEFITNAELPRDDPARKKIVVVAQGTVEIDPNQLIIPTMHAVSDLPGVVLVIILGVKGRELPAGTDIPTNTRAADYLRYGAILPHADVWVHNGGYGAVTQGIVAGVPCVVAGEGQEKPANVQRVAWSGIGINLQTARPTADQVRGAVLEVLEDEKYRSKVRAMQAEMEQWDSDGIIEREVLNLVT